jgi:hypothetical protein
MPVHWCTPGRFSTDQRAIVHQRVEAQVQHRQVRQSQNLSRQAITIDQWTVSICAKLGYLFSEVLGRLVIAGESDSISPHAKNLFTRSCTSSHGAHNLETLVPRDPAKPLQCSVTPINSARTSSHTHTHLQPMLLTSSSVRI